MRDISVDDIIFNNADGEVLTLKGMREYPVMTGKTKYSPLNNDEIDEIAVKFYNDNSEYMSYKIIDMNVEAIIDNGFSLKNIKQLEIPN